MIAARRAAELAAIAARCAARIVIGRAGKNRGETGAAERGEPCCIGKKQQMTVVRESAGGNAARETQRRSGGAEEAPRQA